VLAEKKAEAKWCSVSQEVVQLLRPYNSTRIAVQAIALSSSAGTAVSVKPLSPELNPICYLLALLAHDFLHVSSLRVKSLTLRLLMSYIYRVFQKELYNFESV
jgi:transposase